MDFEIPNEQINWLEKWRLQAGLRAETVDEKMGFPLGTTTFYETMGLVKVSLAHLTRMVGLYRIDPVEFVLVVQRESKRTMHLRS